MIKNIKIDQYGYEKMLNELKILKEKLNVARKLKSEAVQECCDSLLGSNADYETARLEEARIYNQIKLLQEQINHAEIIEKGNDVELVDLYDYVNLFCDYGDEIVDGIFQLQSLPDSTPNENYCVVSINSPLGAAIYKKQVGTSNEFIVNSLKYTVIIQKKLTEEEVKNINKGKTLCRTKE